jgi:hypothetical protein
MTHEQYISLTAMILMAPHIYPPAGWAMGTVLTVYLVAMKLGWA